MFTFLQKVNKIKKTEFSSHFKWPINFIQTEMVERGPFKSKCSHCLDIYGDLSLNFFPNKLENFKEMDGYLGKYNYRYII